MSAVFTATIASGIELTLAGVLTDSSDGISDGATYKKFLEDHKMDKAYEDRLEMAGPGLLAEKPEGQEMATGSLREGYINRLLARAFALKIVISREAVDDNQYDSILRAGSRLKRAAYQSVEIDSAQMLVRGFDTSYVYGTGQPLFSEDQPLANGGTFSNVMGTPASPSESSVVEATTQILKYPDRQGIQVGYEPRRIVCPVDQWATWSRLLKSTFGPVTQNFAAINVVNRDLDLSVVKVLHWNNTATHWAIQTDCPDKPKIGWRVRFESNSWMENSQMLMCYGIYGRWGRTNDDPRAWLGVEAS